MQDGEIAIDVSLVDSLLRMQFPHWHGLPLREVKHGGTSHSLFRLGDELTVRLPRREWAWNEAAKEAAIVPLVAPHVPVAVPEPVALGLADDRYPYQWSVVRWIEGELAPIEDVSDGTPLALAEVVRSLHGMDATGLEWTPNRGRPVEAGDDELVRVNIAALGGSPRLTAVWEEALRAPRWDGPGRWLHADLHVGNLLFREGELTGVIDWGSAGIGDPAANLMTAWLYLDERGRARFRRELTEFDDATWARSAGWALHLAVLALPYYRDTNKFLADIATRTLDQLCPGWDG
ncbi:aminoglycoside phosphotransferase family protein [Lentzea sp. NPDC058450]|uniref:aminoglycoside phosphotransferase family protein n=1 Tax=Lentzea sp. NPDC058450 TaxID=3346505 RepID=UPI003662A151